VAAVVAVLAPSDLPGPSGRVRFGMVPAITQVSE
jgi:hypothetical protein